MMNMRKKMVGNMIVESSENKIGYTTERMKII